MTDLDATKRHKTFDENEPERMNWKHFFQRSVCALSDPNVSFPLTGSLILENSHQVALPGNVRYPYYGFSSGRKSFVFDLAQKKVIWEQEIPYYAHVTISVDEDVVIVCNPGGITCTNFVTNEVVFSAPTVGFGPLASAVVHRNNLFVYVLPDEPYHSKLVAMNTSTKPWTQIGTKIFRPLIEQQVVKPTYSWWINSNLYVAIATDPNDEDATPIMKVIKINDKEVFDTPFILPLAHAFERVGNSILSTALFINFVYRLDLLTGKENRRPSIPNDAVFFQGPLLGPRGLATIYQEPRSDNLQVYAMSAPNEVPELVKIFQQAPPPQRKAPGRQMNQAQDFKVICLPGGKLVSLFDDGRTTRIEWRDSALDLGV